MARDDARPCGVGTLFVPLAEARSVWLAVLALLTAYALTMARDLSLYDSGELALAAVVLGLGHPPGQPLHTLLGFVLSKIPLWSPLVGVVLASAIPGALTLVPATSLAQSLLGASASPRAQRIAPWLLAALGLHVSIWEPATRVEVYALATLFAVWAAAKLAVQRVETSALRLEPGERKQAALRVLWAAVALGLCASVNPMTAVCVAIGVAPAILARIYERELPAYAVVLAVLGGVAALLPYAYVPLVAQRTDVLLWGAPRDGASLIRYLTGADYARNRSIDAGTWVAHGVAWLWHCTMRGLAPWLLLGVLGHVALRKRSELGGLSAPVTLLLLAALVASNVVWNLDVPDYDGYMAAGVWLVASGAVALCAELVSAPERVRSGYLVSGLLVICAFLPAPSVFARTRSHDHVARALAERVLHEAPDNAIVITESDSIASPLLYVQEAERLRPDVVVLAYGLASSSWHWEHIVARHPRLAPFSLKGPGKKAGRVRRFIDAQADRVVLVESARIAQELGLQFCGYGLYFNAGATCEVLPPRLQEDASELIERLAQSVGRGSPSAIDALSAVSYELGVSLWRGRFLPDAYTALLAGVPREMQPHPLPGANSDALAKLVTAPALAAELPQWRRGAALGDPARNLFVIGALFHAAGAHDEAQRFVQAAAADGLPEATP